MAGALLQHLFALPVFAWRLLAAVPAEGWRHAWKRLPLFAALWLLYALLNCQHVIGHLLDEVLFPGWRRTGIRQPVFILGIPRSGTTFLQRLLARDPAFTTLTTWEALLAPSISERYLYRAVGTLLRPLEHLVLLLRRRLFHRMDAIHAIRLLEPEEDFLLLLPLQACLLLAFVCPGSRAYWRAGRFDRDYSATQRRQLLAWYATCLKKHLYYHGADRRLLSKNPSLTSWTGDLLDAFPDARLVACTRAPAEVVPSQLSALRPAMTVLGDGNLSASARRNLLDLLHHYYGVLVQYRNHKRVMLLPMTVLQSDIETAMTRLAAFLDHDRTDRFLAILRNAVEETGKYSSTHRYNLAEFALSETDINNRFLDVWPPDGATRHGGKD